MEISNFGSAGQASAKAQALQFGMNLTKEVIDRMIAKRQWRRQNAINQYHAQMAFAQNESSKRQSDAFNSISGQMAQYKLAHINPNASFGQLGVAHSTPTSSSAPVSSPIDNSYGVSDSNNWFAGTRDAIQQLFNSEQQSRDFEFQQAQQKRQFEHDVAIQQNDINKELLMQYVDLKQKSDISDKDRALKEKEINDNYDIAERNIAYLYAKLGVDDENAKALVALQRDQFEFNKTKANAETDLTQMQTKALYTENERLELNRRYDELVAPVIASMFSYYPSDNKAWHDISSNEEDMKMFLEALQANGITYRDLCWYIQRNNLRGDSFTVIKEAVTNACNLVGEVVDVAKGASSVYRDVKVGKGMEKHGEVYDKQVQHQIDLDEDAKNEKKRDAQAKAEALKAKKQKEFSDAKVEHEQNLKKASQEQIDAIFQKYGRKRQR